MTGYTIQVKLFDNFFNQNYSEIRGKSVYFFGKEGGDELIDDQLSDMYLKMKQRIIASGFTGSNFMSYVYTSLWNQFRHYKNLQKQNARRIREGRRIKVNVEDCYSEIESQHTIEKMEEQLEIDIYHRNQRVSEQIFKYVERKYSPVQYAVFKQYFLNVGETYQTISNRTGLPKAELSTLLKLIKADLKETFKDYGNEFDN